MRRGRIAKPLSLATALLLAAATPIVIQSGAPVAAATTTTTTTALTPSASLGKSLITIYAQNLRASASAEAAVTGAVRAWESVGLLDATAGWVKVVDRDGEVGWLRGNAVKMTDPDLPYWAAPLYELFPGSWKMGIYPTRAAGNWLASAPIRATNSATATIINSVRGGDQLHLIAIPAGEFVPVITQGGTQGWISRYQLMGAPTLARTEEVSLTQIAPDRFRLELHGQIGAVGITNGAFQVALPDEPNRRGNLAVKTAGVDRLRFEPSGLVVPLTGEIGYKVIDQSPSHLIVELGPKSTATPPSTTPPTTITPPTTTPPTTTEPEAPKGPLSGKTVILDPGHGGEDPGTAGNGLTEKLLTLEMAKKVTTQLEAAGARVVMTRTTDYRCGTPAIYAGMDLYQRGRQDLACRSDLTAQEKANLFLSIHYNSLAGTTASGTETYYSPASKYLPESKRFAGLIQAEVVKAAGLIDRGVRSNDFYVITYTEAPSALVELGFLTSSTDAGVLAQPATKERVATALAQGVIRYFE